MDRPEATEINAQLRKWGNMASPNSKDKEGQPTREERSRAAVEVYSIKFEERSRVGQIPVRKGQRLDVDGILARSSLPKTLSQ